MNQLQDITRFKESVSNNSGTINIHEIPVGKYHFKATIRYLFDDYYQLLELIENSKYVASELKVYSYALISLTNIEMRINGNWIKVNCCEDFFIVNAGKKFLKLQTEEEDRIEFDAIVDDSDIRFGIIEFEQGDFRRITDRDVIYDILPNYYKGNITVNLPNITNYEQNHVKKLKVQLTINREKFIENLPEILKMGAKSFYFEGRSLKHLSNLQKIPVQSVQ